MAKWGIDPIKQDELCLQILKHQGGIYFNNIRSFNYFVTNSIEHILRNRFKVEVSEVIRIGNIDHDVTILFTFKDAQFEKPQISKGDKTIPLHPRLCLQEKTTYMAQLSIEVNMTVIIDTDEPIHKSTRVVLGSIPIMLWSVLCNMTPFSPDQHVTAREYIDMF